jgi:ubiquitin C-terminal hydrolase
MKIRKQEYSIVHFKDLEKLIKKVYGKEYNIPASMEWSNDSSHEVNINKTFSAWNVEMIKWLSEPNNNEVHGALYAILNDLCLRGELPAGEYLIEVCW